MFDEPIRAGLFAGHDISYDPRYDRAIFNDTLASVENGNDQIIQYYMGEGTTPIERSIAGEGFLDALKTIAPYAVKALGSIGSHLLDKSKKASKLSNTERVENQAYIKRLIEQETDPTRRMELIDRLRI